MGHRGAEDDVLVADWGDCVGGIKVEVSCDLDLHCVSSTFKARGGERYHW